MTAPTHEHFASLQEIFLSVKQDSHDNCLKAFLAAAGVVWHPQGERTFVSRPSTRIVSLGGIPFVGAGDELALASAPGSPLM